MPLCYVGQIIITEQNGIHSSHSLTKSEDATEISFSLKNFLSLFLLHSELIVAHDCDSNYRKTVPEPLTMCLAN